MVRVLEYLSCALSLSVFLVRSDSVLCLASNGSEITTLIISKFYFISSYSILLGHICVHMR